MDEPRVRTSVYFSPVNTVRSEMFVFEGTAEEEQTGFFEMSMKKNLLRLSTEALISSE